MPNVLDLKHPEPVAQPPPAPVGEPVVAEPVTASDALDEDLFALSVNALAGPSPVEWEARHTLSDAGRYRHYLVLAGFAVVGGAVSWWQASWLTFLTVALALAAWELHERLGKPVRVRVDETGVSIDEEHFPHASLSSFDLHQMADGSAELSLATRRWHSAHLRIPLGGQDPYEVRNALLHYVAEERHGVHFVDWLIRRG